MPLIMRKTRKACECAVYGDYNTTTTTTTTITATATVCNGNQLLLEWGSVVVVSGGVVCLLLLCLSSLSLSLSLSSSSSSSVVICWINFFYFLIVRRAKGNPVRIPEPGAEPLPSVRGP
ncbi:MAG: hypothetical protein H9Q65_02470 [Spiroplasma ixodetis]|nr:hypothetical protein [Spiroplasma ixodetis]